MDDNARADGERGLVPERESVYEFDTSANVLGISPFRQTVPKFSGKRADFAKYQHEFINFAKGEGLDWVFVLASDSTRDIDVGDPGLTVEYLGRIRGKDMVAAHARARRLLVASFEGKRKQDILLRLHSPGAIWRKLADMFPPKTNGGVMLRQGQHFYGLKFELLGTLYLIQNTTFKIGKSTTGLFFLFARDIPNKFANGNFITHILV